MSRWKVTLSSLAVLSLTLTGCGTDDPESDAKSEPTSTSTPTPTLTAAQVAACDALIEAPAATFAAFNESGPDGLTLEAWQKIGSHYSTIATGTTGAAQASATTVVDTITEAGETKNLKLLESDEFNAAAIASAAAGPEQCGYASTDFEAMEMPAKKKGGNPEYHYTSLPKTLTAGNHSLSLNNQGKTFHEVIVVRLKDSYEGTLEDFKKLPDEEAFKVVEGGTITFAAPGTTSILNAELTPGRYIFYCHIPLMDPKTNRPILGEQGPIWHFVLGMAEEVTVS